MDLSKIGKKVAKFAQNNSEKILLGVGIVGSVATTVVACKQTVKATRLVDKTERELGRKLTAKEKVKICWKTYLVPAGMQATSVASLVLSGTESARKMAVVTAACKVSEQALQKVVDKTEEIVGKKKMEEIDNAIAQDMVDANPYKGSYENLPRTSPDANMLCYETLTGHYFLSRPTDLDKALNDLNYTLNSSIDDDVTYSWWFSCLNVNSLISEMSDEYAWIQSRDGLLEYKYSYSCDDKEYPCCCISFNTKPTCVELGKDW